ncbi:MAG: patatin-like phospholipase family protein [Rickettsiales bacterium]|jgi:hypothetical protein|nr:patatin-like phospholipase family protein [Rickettsiales bacterium]
MYNILSVDGRGATQALIVTKITQIIDEKLKQHSGVGIIKHFDHISASSTASLPVALIAHGYDPKKTYEIVKNTFKNAFISSYEPKETNHFYNKAINFFKNAYKKYANSDQMKFYTLDHLDDLLKDFPKINMGESKIPLLLLSAKNSHKLETHYFSSTVYKDMPLSDVIKSCVADKLYFPAHKLTNQGYFDHSFISKSSLEASLSYISTTKNLNDHSFLVVKIGFDNLNITDYLKTEAIKDKISPINLLDISMSSGEDMDIHANRFLKGNFWNIVVTQENGILEELHKFDKILDDAKIESIIKSSKICNNIMYECESFHEGIDALIKDGLLNNPSLANELDTLINELDNFTS